VKTETRDRFHLLGGIWTSDCSLDITDGRKSDTGSYVFQVEKEQFGNYTYEEMNLKVTGRQGP
jgi:hypothetical protein